MADRRYTQSHEWVLLEGEVAKVGISEFAVGQLGDVVYLDLPERGRKVEAGEVLGDIESVKAVSQIYAPISGEVVESNDELSSRPELVNVSPLDRGWIVRIRAANQSEIDELMSSDHYEAFLVEQA